jgi:isovaleryl-CoA dehydrogenase
MNQVEMHKRAHVKKPMDRDMKEPKQKLNIFAPTPEHVMLRQSVRKFVEEKIEPDAMERDAKEFFDLNLFRTLGDLGLLGLTAPEEFGGSGMDATAAVIVHEELACADPGFCLAYLAHSMLCVNNIAQNCNDEQKQKYLPKLCKGEWIGAMAMSEPQVGTDVLGMKCRAIKSSDGYLINGRKMWITNGSKDSHNNPADVLFLYAKTGEQKNAISSFIVEAGQNGYSVGQNLKGKLGMRASNTAEIVLEDCKLSLNHLVGKEGDSLLHMMRNLEIERLALAAISLGIAQRCLMIMTSYANERTAFDQPLIKFGQIQKHIAESYAKYQACRSYIYNVAYNHDLAEAHNRIDSDAAKLLVSTMAKEIADSAIQVLGGYGYMAEYIVERLWRDAKLLEIGGGTIEAHQKNIANDLSKNPRAIFSSAR